MGASHGKILITQSSTGESPIHVTPASKATCGGLNTNGVGGKNSEIQHQFRPLPLYEQAGESVKKPRLRLKQFFKVANEFQDQSTPLKVGQDIGGNLKSLHIVGGNDEKKEKKRKSCRPRSKSKNRPSEQLCSNQEPVTVQPVILEKNKLVEMEDPLVILNGHNHNPVVSNGAGDRQSRKFTRDWAGFFRRKAGASNSAGGDRTKSPTTGKTRKQQLSNKKLVKEHFDPRVTAKYDIKALIGKGSFSRVVRVEQRTSGQHFAMKLLPTTSQNSANYPPMNNNACSSAFENELSILSRVNHEHIIRLHEVFRTPSRIYMVLELATGGELYDKIIMKGSFNEVEAADTLKMALDGLSYIHRLGITHRDLKPENLLYLTSSPDSRLLITDFGLASQSKYPPGSRENLMTDTCGTPEYIAPEVLMRFPYDNKVDMWAIGVIAYILLSGIMPFDSDSRTRLYRQIIRGKYFFYHDYWRHISQSAKAFVTSLLETDPVERLTAEECLRHPWLLAALRPGYRPILSSPYSSNSSAIESPLHKSHSTKTGQMSQVTVTTGNGTFVTENAGYTFKQPERTRSTRSIRSVARSDHGHRVKPKEVEKLSKDPEIRKLVFERQSSRNSSLRSGVHQSPKTANKHVIYIDGFQNSKDYGVV